MAHPTAGAKSAVETKAEILLLPKMSASASDEGTGVGQCPSFLRTPKLTARRRRGLLSRQQLNLLQGTIELYVHGRVFDNLTLFHVLEHVAYPGSLLNTSAGKKLTSIAIALTIALCCFCTCSN